MYSSDNRPDDPAVAATAFLGGLTDAATVLVAVSGGSDSVGLLVALHRAISQTEHSRHRLVAVTVDHRLRPEAAVEADEVGRICRGMGISHRIMRWDDEKPKSGISAAARDARYRLLMQAADLSGADVIVTGHTFDDQMETITMRAARSDAEANLGLAGMAEAVLLERRRWLLRPLLSTSREAIRNFLRQECTGWIDDPSNVDRHYERVRVRDEIAGQSSHASLLAEAAGERRLRLSQEASLIARRHLKVRHGVLAELAPEALNEEVAALRHLLSVLTAILGGRAHLPAGTTMDRVMSMLEARRMGRMTAGRVIFDLRRQGLYMHRESRDIPMLHLNSSQQAVWDGRYRLTNSSGGELPIGPCLPDREMAGIRFADVPPAIAMRAMAVMPHLASRLSTGETSDKASVIVEPILAPFDRFLPQFDLILATQLGEMFGCEALPATPIKVFERKS